MPSKTYDWLPHKILTLDCKTIHVKYWLCVILGWCLWTFRHGILLIIDTSKFCKFCFTQPFFSIFNVKCGNILKFYTKYRRFAQALLARLSIILCLLGVTTHFHGSGIQTWTLILRLVHFILQITIQPFSSWCLKISTETKSQFSWER